jgi:alkylation response protein AidB-like acyl-CoA dehydrogenase
VDFRFGEELDAIRALAREILGKELPVERLREVEGGDEGFDRRLWSTLAQANLLGLAVPEALGGSGMGFLELCALLEELGRAVAPVPALPSLVLGGLPIAAFGSEAQRRRWLPALARGELVLGAALVEDATGRVVPVAKAAPEGAGWRLAGRASLVPAGGVADWVLLPATTPGGVGVFLVEAGAPGLERETSRISTGERLASLELDGVSAGAEQLLGGDARGGAAIAAWIRDRALVGVSALQLGIASRALEITAQYVSGREQFGQPIGAFQAVQHRAADAYIDLECMRWTTWRAAWKLAEGRPAARDARVAKFWAAEGGARIAATAQHLHGGMGVDVDYPIHRYFLWAKRLELAWGGASPQLAQLGRDLARGAAEEEA